MLETLFSRYRQRWQRRRLLWRALRSRHQLTEVQDRTSAIRPGDVLAFLTVRNEAPRLPYFLSHHRRLGVRHFVVVDNASTDGTLGLLSTCPDVSVWSTVRSYKAARFGMDWITWLQMRHGHGHWCLTLDADELLVYPGHDAVSLPDLTARLEARGAEAMGALMLDLYPSGPLSQAVCAPGEDPVAALEWFDPGGYDWEVQPRYGNISVRGGPRRRVFFADSPDHAPHLHKLPLVRWNRRFAWVSSTHIALPRRLNGALDARRGLPTGVLLHTKFLSQVIDRSAEEKHRAEHFTHPGRYDTYYDRIVADPDLWTPDSVRYQGWRQLVSLGLMAEGR
jgi:hypothetical protein